MTQYSCALLLLCTGCLGEADIEIPPADPRSFEADVYPILLADCGFAACHGDARRFFVVYGPGRQRLDAATPVYEPATAEELALSFTRARSMLVSEYGARHSPLLRKPLSVDVGGAEHAGIDGWGDDVYATKRDPRWETLFFWATEAER